MGRSPALSAVDNSFISPVTFTLNWFPTADHAGYYAAMLDPRSHQTVRVWMSTITLVWTATEHHLSAAGGWPDRHDHGALGMWTLNARLHGIPIVTIASWYQKDATTFMLHPENSAQSLADLNHNPMYIPGISRVNYQGRGLRLKVHIYSDEQLKPFDLGYRARSLDPAAGWRRAISLSTTRLWLWSMSQTADR